MSNGPILDLVAKGQLDEDIIDIENKQSIFKFDIEKKNKYTKGDMINYPQGRPNWGNTVRFNIERRGDMLTSLYLVVKLPKLSVSNLNTTDAQDENDPDCKYRVRYPRFIGNVLMEKATLYINDAIIDEIYGDYCQLYTDLYFSDWNRKAMIGLDDIFNRPNLKIDAESVYIPLSFWFCNNEYKPLPILAMQNSNIYVDIKFRNFNECTTILELDDNNILCHSNIIHQELPLESAFMISNYYYLDLEERKQVASQDYELLITQCQVRTTNMSNLSANLSLKFNNVVKDMFFFVQPERNKKYGDYFNFSNKMDFPPVELINNVNKKLWDLEPKRHLLSRGRLLFDGIERIEWRDAKYFYYMQNHENYENKIESYIYLYSFNIDPTKYSNNSGANFSRIEESYLQVEIKPDKFIVNYPILTTYPRETNYELKCYATNFNILIIKNGLVGLKYSN